MKLSDTLQIISLLAVVIALLLNYRQARETGRQAQETARQVQISNLALRHESYRQTFTNNGSVKDAILLQNPALLEWYLTTRSIPPGSHDDNLRMLYIYRQLDVHESAFMACTADALPSGAWTAWLEVIRTDIAIAEFESVWLCRRSSYVAEFAALIDGLRQDRDAAAKASDDT